MKNKHTILIIDDDPDDVEVMKEVFNGHNTDFSFVHAVNGNEGLHFLNSAFHLPSLIILDMNMPVLDGKETLKLLKKETKFHSIPVVMFTTSSNEQDRDYCNGFGVALVTKPGTIKQMNELVAQMIQLCHAC